MSAKTKALKPVATPITLGVVNGLRAFLPQFKTPTYAAMQKIDVILKKLDGANETNQKVCADFYKANELDEKEEINGNHPLFTELFGLINAAETPVLKNDVAAYTQDDFNQSVDGMALNYNDRKFLNFWLVK